MTSPAEALLHELRNTLVPLDFKLGRGTATLEDAASLDDAGQPAATERLARFLLPGITAKPSAVLAFQYFARSHDVSLQAGKVGL